MAMSPCRECKNPVSTEAKVCPHCGVPTPVETILQSMQQILVVATVIAGICVLGVFALSARQTRADHAAAVVSSDERRQRWVRDSTARADSAVTYLQSTSAATLRALPDSALKIRFGFLDRYTPAGAGRMRLDSARPALAAIAARERAATVVARVEHVVRGAKATCTQDQHAHVTDLVKAHGEWTDEMLGTVACRLLGVGMTAAQLAASLGKPESINVTQTQHSWQEQWVYAGAYVYVVDDVVTSYRPRAEDAARAHDQPQTLSRR
jgi:hypothetical protein